MFPQTSMKKILFIIYSVFSFFVLALSGRGYAATYAYVSNSYDNTVSVLHTSSNTVTTIVDVGEWPYGVAVSPEGEYIYVANGGHDTVSVIRTFPG